MLTPVEELLIHAVKSSVGVAVQSNDIEHLRRHLNITRAKLRTEGHDSFDCLQFYTSPHSLSELWIVKETKDAVRQ